MPEILRGQDFDLATTRRLARSESLERCQEMARAAGQLLGRAELGSVDAFVVATALTFSRAVIATADPGDIGRLAAPQLTVFAL